jgi:hypothetical protein
VSAYKETQVLVTAAYEKGFDGDGLVYQSMRAPDGVVLPDSNLVIFENEELVRVSDVTSDGI